MSFEKLGSKAIKICKLGLSFRGTAVMKPLCCLIYLFILILHTEAKNNTEVAKYYPKSAVASVCQDEQFECYLHEVACRNVATKKFMLTTCQYTCGYCLGPKNSFAFPKKYAIFFTSPQFKYYSNNYYSGYNGYCCGCYGGGFVGFAGYPGFNGFGLNGYGLLLNPIEGFLGGLGLAIGNGLANLGALLSHGALGSYGYGFGNSYYCIDYLPACYQYIPYCYSPLSYYYSCMVRYCAATCGLCAAGSIGSPGLIPNYNPALYPTSNQGYNQGGYIPQQQPYYGNQQQPYYPYQQQTNGGQYYYPYQQQSNDGQYYYGNQQQQQQQPYYGNQQQSNGYQQQSNGAQYNYRR